MTSDDLVRRRARQLAAQAAASGDPDGWFETLYAEASAGCATDDQNPVRDPAMMPWPLTRRELEAMAGNTLTVRSVEKFLDDEDPPKLRWRAEFTRPQG